MNLALVISVLTQILDLLPNLGINSATVVGKFISIVENFMPLVMQEATSLVPIVQNIITALQNTGAATADQLASLDALNASCDDAFEAAATAAGAQAAPAAPVTGS